MLRPYLNQVPMQAIIQFMKCVCARGLVTSIQAISKINLSGGGQ